MCRLSGLADIVIERLSAMARKGHGDEGVGADGERSYALPNYLSYLLDEGL